VGCGAARDVTALGSNVILFVLVFVVATGLALAGKRRNAAFLVASTLSGAALSTLIKLLVDRN
jgi:hypothetical protein